MAELVDAADLKSADGNVVGVQVPLPPLAFCLFVAQTHHLNFLDGKLPAFGVWLLGLAEAGGLQSPRTSEPAPCIPCASWGLPTNLPTQICRPSQLSPV